MGVGWGWVCGEVEGSGGWTYWVWENANISALRAFTPPVAAARPAIMPQTQERRVMSSWASAMVMRRLETSLRV